MTRRTLDLWSMLPRYNRRIDETGDLKAFIGCLQNAVDCIVKQVDALPANVNLELAPIAWVGSMLEDLGNPFDFALTDPEARRLAAVLVETYRQKGTARGITNAIRLFLGLEVALIDCHIVTHDQDGVRVGADDPASLYSFDVVFAQPLHPEQRLRVRALVEYLKPAHTHLVNIRALD